MPFTAWKQKEKNRPRDRKNLFTMTLGGFVIAVRINSLNDSKLKEHCLEPTY